MYAEIVVLVVAIFEISSGRNTSLCSDLRRHKNYRLLGSDLDCGAVSDPLTFRVLGGKEAELSEFPWLARLVYRSLAHSSINSNCGGFVISDRYILSAAHCCYVHGEELLFVRLGEHDVKKFVDCDYKGCAPPVVDILVENKTHPFNYDPKSDTADICLIRLAEKIVFNDFISPICLPFPCRLQTANFAGVEMTGAGWGRLDNAPYPRWPRILQKLTLPVVGNNQCSLKRREAVQDSNMCAGGILGHDVCRGDSGGPLMLLDSHGGLPRYYAIGIVSYGQTCSSKDTELMPSVYTRVTRYLTWILNSIYE